MMLIIILIIISHNVSKQIQNEYQVDEVEDILTYSVGK